jgi:type IV secretion system protein VirB10
VSTKAKLQTPDEVLESPVEDEPARGLVPRAGLFLALGSFIAALVMFAVYDLSRSSATASDPAKDVSANSGTPQMAVDRVGPAPSPTDVADIANAQVVKVAAADAAINTRVAAPADVGTQIRPGAPIPPVGFNRSSAGPQDVQVTAQDQRSAEGATSTIISLSGGSENGVGGALTRSGLPGVSAIAGVVDPIQQQIDELLTKAKATPASDPVNDIAKAFASVQATPVRSTQGKDQTWLRESAVEKVAEATYAKLPASQWMIFQGTRIPIVTREAINSDLPGPVTALSTAAVYDSINQCAVLIPAGTKFIGSYSADIRPGQSRMLLAYRRMIFPDGRSVELDGAQAVDQRGSAGADGDVNNHFLQMFGYGFAVAWLADRSTAGSGITVTQPNGVSTSTTIAGQVLAETAGRIMSRNAVIPPTITIDVGARMFVTLVRDISLTPISRNHCK